MEGLAVGFLCALVFGLLIGSLIGGVILRAACALFNKLAGASSPKRRPQPEWDDPPLRSASEGEGITDSPDPFDLRTAREQDSFERRIRAERGVPEPDLGPAMLIAFVSMLVNMGVGFVLGLVLGGAAGGVGRLMANVISLPIGILVLGGMSSAMLPTTFGKGMLVALLYLAIGLAIAVVVGVIFFGIALALGGGRGW